MASTISRSSCLILPPVSCSTPSAAIIPSASINSRSSARCSTTDSMLRRRPTTMPPALARGQRSSSTSPPTIPTCRRSTSSDPFNLVQPGQHQCARPASACLGHCRRYRRPAHRPLHHRQGGHGAADYHPDHRQGLLYLYPARPRRGGGRRFLHLCHPGQGRPDFGAGHRHRHGGGSGDRAGRTTVPATAAGRFSGPVPTLSPTALPFSAAPAPLSAAMPRCPR